jgi:Predicted glycosyltransferases
MMQHPFTVVAAVNDRRVLHSNLLRSPELCGRSVHQVLLREGYACAAHAYNSAIEEARHDLMLFVHQDVYLPDGWFSKVLHAIRRLDREGIRWGVIGAYGPRKADDGRPGPVYLGRIHTTGLGLHGEWIDKPEPVETLDEIVLVFRKSSGLRFDPQLPHFHMYGVDVCLSARSRGWANYAVPAPCIHNTNQLLVLPAEFYRCYRYIKHKWARFLPIRTSCIEISRFDAELHWRKTRELLARALPHRPVPMRRVADPRMLLPFDRSQTACPKPGAPPGGDAERAAGRRRRIETSAGRRTSTLGRPGH